jgi:hypothetical protein
MPSNGSLASSASRPATDWTNGGWDIRQSVELAKLLKGRAVDLIDASSGGIVPHVRIPVGPGYQTPFAEQIRRESGHRDRCGRHDLRPPHRPMPSSETVSRSGPARSGVPA